MSVWEWIDDFAARARSAGDQERLRLTGVLSDAYEYRHTDPDRMLALFAEGRRLAVVLHEPWWILFFDYWYVETLIYYKEDYRTLLDAAVKLTVDVHKPTFAQHPLRLPIYANLIAAYLCVDPHGYADEIRAALDYAFAQDMPHDGVLYLFLFRREWFAWEMGRLAEARADGERILALAEADPERHRALHHLVGAHVCLCRISHRQGDWNALDAWSRGGEELAERRGGRYEKALCVLWKAVWARHAGQIDDARRLCRVGMAQMGRLGKAPDESYFDALCHFHELGGELGEALSVRQRQRAILADRGQLATECLCALQDCRLLAMMGRSLDEAVQVARGKASRLRRPAFYLEKLERILHGEFDPL
jgi:hypothetical protein